MPLSSDLQAQLSAFPSLHVDPRSHIDSSNLLVVVEGVIEQEPVLSTYTLQADYPGAFQSNEVVEPLGTLVGGA